MYKHIFCLLLALTLISCGRDSGNPVLQNDQGILSVSVTDQHRTLEASSSSAWKNIFIEISALEARTRGGGWEVISSSAAEIDLLSIQGESSLIAQSNLKAGNYTGLRMQFESGKAVTSSGECTLHVPSRRLMLDADFEVRRGSITGVVLDFNSAESVHLVQRGNQCMLTPVLHLLTVTN